MHTTRRHARRSGRGWLLRVAAACLLAALATSRGTAQCSLSCSGAVNLSLPGPADACASAVTPVMLGVSLAGGCAPGVDVDLYTPGGARLGGELDADGFRLGRVTADQLGSTLRARATHRASGAYCETDLRVFDALGPMLSVSDTSVSVLTDLVPDTNGGSFPAARAQDCSGVSLSHADSVVRTGCGAGLAYRRTYRTWYAADGRGNPAVAQQVITQVRVELDSLEAPADTTLPCTLSSVAGVPYGLPGQRTPGGGFVSLGTLDGQVDNLYWSHSDEVFGGSNGARQVLRTWRMFDDCRPPSAGSNPRSLVQVIRLADLAAPALAASFDTLTYAVTTGDCRGDIVLPAVQVADDCDADPRVRARVGSLVLDANGGYLGRLSLGEHELVYEATDAAGNRGTLRRPLRVVDRSAPVLVTRASVTVSLGGNGEARLTPDVFDTGSYDDCGPYTLAIRRALATDRFAASVRLACADLEAGGEVLLELRAVDGVGNANFREVRALVTDQLAPQVLPPGDVAADCSASLADLSVFGEPFVYDNCSVAVEDSVAVRVDSCRRGTVTRTWTASDPSGNVSVARQTITLRHVPSFRESDVAWPADLTLSACTYAASPDSLPAGSRRPTWDERACARVSASYRDRSFGAVGPDCEVILREWTVIESCTFDGAGAGEWRHTQTIRLRDDAAPTALLPPSDTSLRTTVADCAGATYALHDPRWRDCSTLIDAQVSVDYGADGAGAADTILPSGTMSLYLPRGRHRVCYTAGDACGNRARVSHEVRVEDGTAPVALCRDTLRIGLGDRSGRALSASEVDLGSRDACGGEVALSLDRDSVRCGDVGRPLTVRLTVRDSAGFASTCASVVVVVEDTGEACWPGPSVVVGRVLDLRGRAVPVSLHVLDRLADTIETYAVGPDGSYAFTDRYADTVYVWPHSGYAPTSGITSFDLYLIGQHILGNQPLTGIAELLSADVNRSGNISAFDMTLTRRLLLGLSTEFPGGRSYGFLPASAGGREYAGGLRDLPWSQAIAPGQSIDSADFSAVKLGDVSTAYWSARGEGEGGLAARASVDSVRVAWAPTRRGEWLAVYRGSPTRLYVATLRVSARELRLSPKLAGRAWVRQLDAGRLGLSALANEGIVLRDGDTLWTARGHAGGRPLADGGEWVDRRLGAAAVERAIGHRFAAADLRDGELAAAPHPNPVAPGGVVRVATGQPRPISVELVDSRGVSMVWARAEEAGRLEAPIPGELLPGVYLLRLRYANRPAVTHRLIVR